MTFYLTNNYRQAKKQLVVFGLNYLVSKMFDRKVSNLGVAMRGVNSDLLGKWITDSVMTNKVIEFPM